MPGRHLFQSLISSSKQISAIAAFVGLSVEIKEGTSNIVKTPTFTSKDGFSVFEAGAIGRYSESSIQSSCGSLVTGHPDTAIIIIASHVRGMPSAITVELCHFGVLDS